jgi:hypothetical protein
MKNFHTFINFGLYNQSSTASNFFNNEDSPHQGLFLGTAGQRCHKYWSRDPPRGRPLGGGGMHHHFLKE